MSFQSLGLSAELLRAVSSQGYTAPTAIQSQAIPVILEGRDVMGIAQTGTGKTAGFALPLLQRLAARDKTGPRTARALVLTPTRELAAQVRQCIADFSLHLPIRAAVVYGGVSIRPQIAELRRGVDIVVATPGRLLDHVTQKTIDLSQVEVLVLDEADRMLDMGFIRDIRKIIAVLPKSRQNLMFSATFNKETTELANRVLRSPARVEVAGSQTTADGISQRVYPVERARKRELLSYLIGSGNWKQVLVFTRTKHAANRLATQLGKDGLSSSAIHGNKSQGARTRALQDFKNGQVRVLVATDIAARGLDIDRLPHVVNFDMPQVAEDYVHRIGRTGRAGKSGEAISLVSPEEKPLLAGIEKLLKRNIDRAPAGDFPASLPAARQHDGESSEGDARTKSPRHTAQAAEGRKTGRQRNRNRRRKEGGKTVGKEAARNPAAARPNQGGRARAGQGR